MRIIKAIVGNLHSGVARGTAAALKCQVFDLGGLAGNLNQALFHTFVENSADTALVYFDDTDPASFNLEELYPDLVVYPAGTPKSYYGALLINKRVFSRIGYFDPNFGPKGGEVEDYFARAGIAGFPLWVANSAGRLKVPHDLPEQKQRKERLKMAHAPNLLKLGLYRAYAVYQNTPCNGPLGRGLLFSENSHGLRRIIH